MFHLTKLYRPDCFSKKLKKTQKKKSYITGHRMVCHFDKLAEVKGVHEKMLSNIFGS